eukprot:1225125-Ditylum_brightwellii.AAC.1
MADSGRLEGLQQNSTVQEERPIIPPSVPTPVACQDQPGHQQNKHKTPNDLEDVSFPEPPLDNDINTGQQDLTESTQFPE